MRIPGNDSCSVFQTLDPSAMTTPFTIQSLSPVSDGKGGIVEEWVTKSTGWCQFEFKKQYEQTNSGVESVADAKIITYAQIDFDPDDTVLVFNKRFRVFGPETVNFNRDNVKVIRLVLAGRDND